MPAGPAPSIHFAKRLSPLDKVADTGKTDLLQAGNGFENPFSSPVVVGWAMVVRMKMAALAYAGPAGLGSLQAS